MVNTTYIAVAAFCNGIKLSDYSDTLSFTTTTCPVPTGVNVSDITETSAKVTWSGLASSYTIEYGESGFVSGQGTKVDVSGSNYTLTNLLDDEEYDVFIRSNCDNINQSGWSAKVTFTTLKHEEEGIVTADGGLRVSLYPNPATGSTTVTLSGVNGEVTITVVDLNGRTVMSDSMSCEGDCVKRLTIDGLAEGAYFVRVNGEGVNTVKKLIVK